MRILRSWTALLVSSVLAATNNLWVGSSTNDIDFDEDGSKCWSDAEYDGMTKNFYANKHYYNADSWSYYCTCFSQSNSGTQMHFTHDDTFTNVKTIIFGMDHKRNNQGNAPFRIKICSATNECNNWYSSGTQLCDYGSCPRGYFDATNMNANGLTIKGFYFKSESNGHPVGICGIFMYKYENWATKSRGTTLTSWIATSA
jgi:hypothetical protein